LTSEFRYLRCVVNKWCTVEADFCQGPSSPSCCLQSSIQLGALVR